MKDSKFPYEDYLLKSEDEEIIWVQGRPFVVKPATDEDIERIGKGYFTMGKGMKIGHYITDIKAILSTK